jgi:hypothetical protein
MGHHFCQNFVEKGASLTKAHILEGKAYASLAEENLQKLFASDDPTVVTIPVDAGSVRLLVSRSWRNGQKPLTHLTGTGLTKGALEENGFTNNAAALHRAAQSTGGVWVRGERGQCNPATHKARTSMPGRRTTIVTTHRAHQKNGDPGTALPARPCARKHHALSLSRRLRKAAAAHHGGGRRAAALPRP